MFSRDWVADVGGTWGSDPWQDIELITRVITFQITEPLWSQLKHSYIQIEQGVQNCPPSITAVLADAFSRENPDEYSHKPYIAGNYESHIANIFVKVSSFVFTLLSPKANQKNLLKPIMKTYFSIKWHLKVIQGQAFYGQC